MLVKDGKKRQAAVCHLISIITTYCALHEHGLKSDHY